MASFVGAVNGDNGWAGRVASSTAQVTDATATETAAQTDQDDGHDDAGDDVLIRFHHGG